jgi:GLPGLI family protein
LLLLVLGHKIIAMKKIFLMAFALMGFFIAKAQVKEGTIVYERKINMHKRITDEQFKAMVPEFNTSKHMLMFSDSTSMYKMVPEDEAPDPFEGGGHGGRRVVMRFSGGDAGELYKNFSLSKSIMQTELGAKSYIIEDSIRQQKWKLTDETKKISGYNCRKAITKQMMPVGGRMRVMTTTTTGDGNSKTDSARRQSMPQLQEAEVVAWYAEDIISPVGPENNGGLPGVILQLDINKGETVYTAMDIKKTVNAKDIKVPSKGKKVTRDEFNKLQEEMMSNMQGGGRTMRFGN